MAEVFLARALDGPWRGRPVVMKRVHEHLADSEELRELFAREGAIAMQLDHPNIVRVLDVGEDDGVPFLVMELLHGVDLRTALAVVMREGTRFHPANACLIASAIAAALHHAHALPLGIVHRDVSPHNVFLGSDGVVKLLDFGIAKTNRAVATRTGVVRGKAGYMSPEQLAGLAVDARSDLFSLGVVLWEMLAGRRLWQLDTETGTARAVRDESAEPPSLYCPEAVGALDALVMQLLAKFPSARPRDAAIVSAALARFARTLDGGDGRANIAEFVRMISGP
jgi:serine/threonine protein kinase